MCGRWPETQAFHYARTETLDQKIRTPDQLKRLRCVFSHFQIQGNRAAATVDDVVSVNGWRFGPVDAHHVGAQVGEQHAGEWRRAKACELNYTDPAKWSAAA